MESPKKRSHKKLIIFLVVAGLLMVGVVQSGKKTIESISAPGQASNTTPTTLQVSPMAGTPIDTPASTPTPAGPATTAGNGTHHVGVDIKAGRYKTEANGGYCGWFRMKDDSGDVHSIIASDSVDNGPMYTTVNDGEFAKFSGGCTWTLQP
jgi:hypothetical protein